MPISHHYDYIIAGAGCAGLSLALKLIHSGLAANRKILLVDRDAKKSNDRTWCFWEESEGFFEPVVYRKWQQLWFYSDGFSGELEIRPYQYKLIRGIDFYNFCFDALRQQPQVHFMQANVDGVFSNETETGVMINADKYVCQYLFNSILFRKPTLASNEFWMLQHFKGWVIETDAPQFNAGTAILMDFRTRQQHGTSFFYVLPFSERKALVEYTLFSEDILPPMLYEQALKTYIAEKLQCSVYKIAEQEFGIIPMTNHRFPSVQHQMIFLGTAGGQTKASSGYTFRFIQKQTDAIIQSLKQNGHPFDMPKTSSRFGFYDSVLLHILQKKKVPGDVVFTELFKKNKASHVFRFLDNETDLQDELRIISALPFFPFLKAGLQEWKQVF